MYKTILFTVPVPYNQWHLNKTMISSSAWYFLFSLLVFHGHYNQLHCAFYLNWKQEYNHRYCMRETADNNWTGACLIIATHYNMQRFFKFSNCNLLSSLDLLNGVDLLFDYYKTIMNVLITTNFYLVTTN